MFSLWKEVLLAGKLTAHSNMQSIKRKGDEKGLQPDQSKKSQAGRVEKKWKVNYLAS